LRVIRAVAAGPSWRAELCLHPEFEFAGVGVWGAQQFGFVYSLPEIARLIGRAARLAEANCRFVSGARPAQASVT